MICKGYMAININTVQTLGQGNYKFINHIERVAISKHKEVWFVHEKAKNGNGQVWSQ